MAVLIQEMVPSELCFVVHNATGEARGSEEQRRKLGERAYLVERGGRELHDGRQLHRRRKDVR